MDFCWDEALKWEYLNGLLSEIDKAHFEKHLAECMACRGEIEELRKTAALLEGMRPPSFPEAWTASAKDHLRIRDSSFVAPVPLSSTPPRIRPNFFLYIVITTGVIAGLSLLFWLVMGGTVQHWLPGLSTASLGISQPSIARTVELITWILSLYSLIFVPSIIDNIYQLMQRGRRRSHT